MPPHGCLGFIHLCLCHRNRIHTHIHMHSIYWHWSHWLKSATHCLCLYSRENEGDEDGLISIQMLMSHTHAHFAFTGKFLTMHRPLCLVAFAGSFEPCVVVCGCNRMSRPSGSRRDKQVPVNLTCSIFLDNVLLLIMRNVLSIAYIIPRITTHLEIVNIR